MHILREHFHLILQAATGLEYFQVEQPVRQMAAPMRDLHISLALID